MSLESFLTDEGLLNDGIDESPNDNDHKVVLDSLMQGERVGPQSRFHQFDRAGQAAGTTEPEPTQGMGALEAFLDSEGLSRMEVVDSVGGPGAGAQFVQGFAEGIVDPLRVFGVEVPEIEAPNTMGESVANLVGTFAGMGISYIPFGFGAGAAVRGASKGLGILGNSPRMLAALRGATGFAAYEAGASERVEDIPGNALVGALLGGPLDAIFVGKAANWRKVKPLDDAPTAAPVGSPLKNVDPDLIAIEKTFAFNEGKSTAELRGALEAAASEETLWDRAHALYGVMFQPNGMIVTPGISNPARFAAEMQKRTPGIKTYSRKVGDSFEVLTYDPRLGKRPVKSILASTEKFLGEGDNKLTVEEFAALIRVSMPGETTPPSVVELLKGNKAAGLSSGKAADGVFIEARFGDPSVIQIAGEQVFKDEFKRFSTLAHEYSHAMDFGRRWSGGDLIKGPSLNDLFKLNRPLFGKGFEPAAIKRLVGTNYSPAHIRKAFLDYDESGLMYEFFLAQVENVKQTARIPNLSRKQINELIINSYPTYFGEPTEMVAWLVQLMALDPKAARMLAPRATRMVSKRILRESPKMKMALTKTLQERPDLAMLDDLLTFASRTSTDGTDEFFRLSQLKPTAQWHKDFQRVGMVPGMEVNVNGKSLEFLKVVGRDKDGQTLVRLMDPMSRKTSDLTLSQIKRPTSARMSKHTDEMKKLFAEELRKTPEWLGLTTPVRAGTVERLIVHLDEFVEVNLSKPVKSRITGKMGSVKKATSGQGEDFFDVYLRENGLMDDTMRNAPYDQKVDRVNAHMEVMEKHGILIKDGDDLVGLYWPDDSGAIDAGEVLTENLVSNVDQMVHPAGLGTLVYPSWQSRFESILRAQGADERELKYYIEGMLQSEAETLTRRLDKATVEMRDAIPRSESVASSLSREFHEEAAQAGVRGARTVNGDYRIISREGQEVARFGERAEADEYLTRLGREDGVWLDSSAPTSSTAGGVLEGAASTPPRPGSMPNIDGDTSFIRRLITSSNIGAAVLTSMESFMRSVEKAGFGAAHSRVFEPTQKAIIAVDNALSQVKRKGLKGRTYKDALEEIDRLTVGLPRKRRELVVRYVESMTKDEIAAPGGLMARGMNELERRFSKRISDMGLQDDVPRIMRVNRVMESFLKNQKKALDETIPKLEAAIRQGKAGDDMVPTLQGLKSLAEETFDTKDELISALGLTTEEKWLINVLDNPPLKGLDNWSIMAVSRHASAPTLGKGFKNGRDQFAKMHKMTAKEVKLAGKLDELFEDVFKQSGIDPKRFIGGYWPHMRMFATEGFDVADEALKRFIPDDIKWVHQRVRTGELDLYEMNPAMVAAKYTRSLLMKQHFDPILPDVKAAIKSIAIQDERSGKIALEYLNELMGKPHESFRNMNKIIDGMAKAVGVTLPPRIAERIVNTMTGLAYGATIPFRPALILRNYMQMFQFTIPRVGPKAFFQGLNKAMTQEGFDEAVKAGAVDLNTLPLFASTEIAGVATENIVERFGPMAGQIGLKWKQIFDRGFTWYRKADDLGRAAAYHAAQARAAPELVKFRKGQISMQELLERSKVMTFDELTQKEFMRMVRAGNDLEAIQKLGYDLARETHFRYGHSNHPAGWGTVWGRLFGQFGTFPVQYKDYIVQGLSRGTLKDRAEFALWHGGVNAGIITTGATVAGADLTSWATMPSLEYTGGPYADMALNFVQAWSGSETERSLAKKNLQYTLPTMANPQSIFVPGSYFLGDLMDAVEEKDPWKSVGEAAGFKYYGPGEKLTFDRLLESLIPGGN